MAKRTEREGTPAFRSSLFFGMTAKERNTFFSGIEPKEYADGEVVFDENSRGDSLYIIDAGQVRIGTVIPGVGEEALSILHEGEFFGEMSLIDGSPRSARAIAQGGATLYAVSRAHFEKLLRSEPSCAARILWNLCTTLTGRLRGANEKIKSFFLFTQGF